MTNSSKALPDPYLVQRGDTLITIARSCGKTVRELQRLNGLPDTARLSVGQTLYLSEETAFGFSAVFLDALRWPIKNLPFRVEFDGKTISGITEEFGTMARQITRTAASRIVVSVQNAEGTWLRVVETTSGYGHKLLTFVSDALVLGGKTEPHPPGAPTRLDPLSPPTPSAGQPSLPTPTQGTPTKNNPNVRKRPTKGPKGQPVIEIGVDLPHQLLTIFANYKEGDISDNDWAKVANRLECEVAVVKAIAQVESGGLSSFWRLNSKDGAHIPALMFERHYFSRLTKGTYDSTHPDISWRATYQKDSQRGKANIKMHDGHVDREDLLGTYTQRYLRLINAYRLDSCAALKSCSWGKFQIMGENHKLCQMESVEDFVAAMCTSEKAQIELLANFIQHKPRTWKNPKDKALGKEISLWDAIKAKNWAAIAFNYNGPTYSENHYDDLLLKAYQKYST